MGVGYFKATTTGTYTFQAVMDDSVVVWLGSSGQNASQLAASALMYQQAVPLINSPGQKGNTTNQPAAVTANLNTGEIYPILFIYNQGGGGGSLKLNITPPSGTASADGSAYYNTKLGTALAATLTANVTTPAIKMNGGLGEVTGAISQASTSGFNFDLGANGIMQLSGANTFSGATTISTGRVNVSGTLSDSLPVTVSSGATYGVNNTDTIGSIAGAGTITSSIAGAKTLTVGGDNTSTTFSGTIQDGSGTLSLTKAGTGNLTLSGSLTYTGATAINSGSIIIQNDAPSYSTSGFSGAGSLVIQSASASFTNDYAFNTAITNLGGLTIGKDGNAKAITLSAAETIAGSINIYGGAITINAGLTASGTNTITLKGSGNITDGSSGYVSATNLLLLGGNVTLDNSASNAISTLAATSVSGLTYLDKDALTIGTVGSTNGVSASGLMSIGTYTGNLTVAQNIVTTNATSSALILNAGINTAAGTSSGGNILISGTPSITVGSGGTAKIYTGSVANSTGLTDLIGSATGRFRYNSDESTTNYTTALSTGLNAIYREAVAVTVTTNSQTMTYGDALGSTGSATGLVNGDTATYTISGASYSTSNNLNVGSYNIVSVGLRAWVIPLLRPAVL